MKRSSLVAVALLAPLGVTASAQAELVERSHEHITGVAAGMRCLTSDPRCRPSRAGLPDRRLPCHDRH
jgi:hypothetical protein